MNQRLQNAVESFETLRPVDNAAFEQQGSREGQEEGREDEEGQEEEAAKQKLREEIAEKEKNRDDEMRETMAVEERVFDDEHESIKTVDRVFEDLGKTIPLPSDLDKDKANLKGDFKELKVALKEIGEISTAAKREVDREGGAGMNVAEITRRKREACEKARELIEAMKEKAKAFTEKVKKSLKEHASNTGQDMTSETAKMIKMQAMFEDVFRNTEFVANRWDNTYGKNEEIENLEDEFGEEVEGIIAENAKEDPAQTNISGRLAEGQEADTRGIAVNPEIADTAAAATENKS